MNHPSPCDSADPHDDFDLLAGIVVRRALDEQRRRARPAACARQPVDNPIDDHHAREGLAARIVGRVRLAWQRQRRRRADTWRRPVNLPLETLAMAGPGGKA